MPPKTMDIKKVGNTYELQREQWRGHVAKISADDDLLDEVKNTLGPILRGLIRI